jgi:hypothetical protein
MISAEQNELMTRIGPGTPAGALLRNYWQPVALVEELQGPRPVKAVRLLGEDLVLVQRNNASMVCSNGIARTAAPISPTAARGRRPALQLPRLALRHDGKCLATPAEPEGSRLCEHIRQKAYPVSERSGVLFAYLGAGEAPAFPHFDCFVAPNEYTFAFKGYWDCNWLQALEVGIDPAHASWLHKFFEDEDPATSYGRQFRSTPADAEIPMSKVLRELDRPEIRVERTAYGMRLQTLRKLDESKTHPSESPTSSSAGLRHPDESRDDHLAVARAGRRLRLLLVFDLHELRRPGRQGHDAGAAPEDLSCA